MKRRSPFEIDPSNINEDEDLNVKVDLGKVSTEEEIKQRKILTVAGRKQVKEVTDVKFSLSTNLKPVECESDQNNLQNQQQQEKSNEPVSFIKNPATQTNTTSSLFDNSKQNQSTLQNNQQQNQKKKKSEDSDSDEANEGQRMDKHDVLDKLNKISNGEAKVVSSGLFNNAKQPEKKQEGLFGNTQEKTGGSLFANVPKSSTGGLFGNTTTNNTNSGSLFGGSNTTNNNGGGLFGGVNNNNNSSGGLFGGVANNNNKSGGLFGNNNDSSKPASSNLFGGATNNNQNNGSSNIFGGASQGGSLFQNLSNTNNNQQQSGGLFGNTGTTANNNNQGNDDEDDDDGKVSGQSTPEIDETKAKQVQYEDIMTRLIQKDVNKFRKNTNDVQDKGYITIERLKDNESSQPIFIYRNNLKQIIFQGNIVKKFSTVKTLNNKPENQQVVTIKQEEEDGKVKYSRDQLKIQFKNKEDGEEFQALFNTLVKE